MNNKIKKYISFGNNSTINEFELDTSEGVEDEADEISDLDFEKQLQFLENINLEK
jgi:hypothetical protein